MAAALATFAALKFAHRKCKQRRVFRLAQALDSRRGEELSEPFMASE